MIQSNITFASNVYVVEGESKLSDKKFLAQVVDPGAIRELARLMPKDLNGRVRFSLPLHGEIYDDSTPCTHSNGDYTHGVIREGGEIVFVNTCGNKECREFAKCQAAPNYRKIVRTERITTENVPIEAEADDSFDFDIDLPAIPRTSRAQKLHLSKTRKREIIEEIKTDVHINEFKRFGVRGHYRHLQDGTVTWVRAHSRHHDRKEVVSRYYVRRLVSVKYRFKDREQLEKFHRILAESKRRVRQQQNPEEAIAQNNTYQLKRIKQIDSAENIIKSSLSSRILVNAGPGTGKTHTVIERLKYIDTNEKSIKSDSVFVLCFSRSAVKVIRDRLTEAMERGEISWHARHFSIFTFDSFATWYLMQTEPKRNLTYNSYDERIEMFIREYEKDIKILNGALSYLIVDEVQDLVGIRARLVQSLLKHITCGFLLLGDECQAIYDYQISDKEELNAARLYEWLEKSFDTLEEYELTHNHRHTDALGKMLAPLRHAMLHQPFNIQKEELTKILTNYDVTDLTAEDIIHCCNGEGRRAILSWSNGDAYRQSQDLYSSGSGINHTVLTGSRKLCFRKEVAMALSGYVQNTIERRTFMKFAVDAGVEKQIAKQLWAGILFAADKDNEDDISVADLKRALIAERRVDEALLAEDDADVVISTIHKAKGREFDTVLLNQSGGIDSSDSIKVYYVALTRAKKDLVVRRNSRGSRGYDIKVAPGRYIEHKFGKLKRVELGIDGDIDPIGFVAKSLPGLDVQARQQYILEKVKVGDKIKISKYRGEYMIVHDGHYIGRLNKEDLKSGV